jgi:hypothetical protein
VEKRIPASEIKPQDVIQGRVVRTVETIPAHRDLPERVKVTFTDRYGFGVPSDEMVMVGRIGSW